ncbi:efflux RND transporter periplasmic adaptor subunit [Desulfocurvus sp. DL9XJH121]
MAFVRGFLCVLVLLAPLAAWSQGPPPALVEVAAAASDTVTPRSDYVGTVYFPEVSEVASEVSGRVLSVHFDEGDRVARAQSLVTLDTSLAAKRLDAARGNREQAAAGLELANIELKRRKRLVDSGSISVQEYDSAFYAARELENKVLALDAEAERLALEIAKSRVPAPFDGVVLARRVERGQWLAAGAAVASLARDDAVDVVVNVPESVLPFVARGQKVEVTAGGKRQAGAVRAVIPLGDVATRTFPVKIRIPGGTGLAQGMRATAHLPVGEKVQAVTVPRDAVILLQDRPVVFAVDQGQARMIPVAVVAYQGLSAAVNGPGLAEGMQVVVKGNERLYPGAPVRTANSK